MVFEYVGSVCRCARSDAQIVFYMVFFPSISRQKCLYQRSIHPLSYYTIAMHVMPKACRNSEYNVHVQLL